MIIKVRPFASVRNTERVMTTVALVLAFAIAPSLARAEADTFSLGTGRDGALTLAAETKVVNAYAPLTVAVTTASREITVGAVRGATTGFAPGDLVIVWQTTGLDGSSAAPGKTGAIVLDGAPVGRYELARVANVAANVLTLTRPLVNGYAANASQIVRVPEYTTVTVDAASVVEAAPWDGASGGIVAFLATGNVSNDGAIRARAAGFRGGIVETFTGPTGCSALDGPSGAGGAAGGGAHKGEGLVPLAFSTATYSVAPADSAYGHGNRANAGGGGNCHNAGGGGGGHGAAGGHGGDPWTGAAGAGGIGGAPLSYNTTTRLAFGGGGGAGEDNNGVSGKGGRGGGVVWFRAAALTGNGTVDADGADGASSGNDGAGGGGAGGLVVVRLRGVSECGGIHVRGGHGGSSDGGHGPGGGGSGGRLFLQATGGSCVPTMTAGASGLAGGAARSGTTDGAPSTPDTPPSGGLIAPTCDVTKGECGGCADDSVCPTGAPKCESTSRACVDPTMTTDAGSSSDAGASDDGGTSDAGASDAGGERSDGGSTADGGSPEGGTDGGHEFDGGEPNGRGDADGGRGSVIAGEGTRIDSESESGASADGSVAGGCSTSPGSFAAGGWLVALATALALRARRRLRAR